MTHQKKSKYATLFTLLDGFFMTKTSTDTALRGIQNLVGKGIPCHTEEGSRSTNYSIAER